MIFVPMYQEGDLKRADQIFHIALKMANDLGNCHLLALGFE